MGVGPRRAGGPPRGGSVERTRPDSPPPLWVCLIEYEHSDGFVEFAYPREASAQLQLRAERDLEETVLDLVVREACSFGVAPIADVGVFGMRGATDSPGECNQHRGDDCSRPVWEERRFDSKPHPRSRPHADTGPFEHVAESMPVH